MYINGCVFALKICMLTKMTIYLKYCLKKRNVEYKGTIALNINLIILKANSLTYLDEYISALA